MSFICNDCNQPQKDNVKPYKVVSEVRKVLYPSYKKRNGSIVTPEGLETVKELDLCLQCYNESKDSVTRIVETKVLHGEM